MWLMLEADMHISEYPVTVKVPGKLFFAGEYAVTRPGGLALVTTIETDFEVTISKRQGKSLLATNVGMADFEFSLSEIEFDKANPWNFTLTALKKLLTGLSVASCEISLEIKSEMGFGRDKKGYGSSASVVCGVVNAVNDYFDLKLSLAERFELAARVHFEVQGSGSMGDIAAIMYGGSVFYRNHDLICPVEVPWEIYVIQTGKAAKTAEKLKIELSDDFFKTSDELVSQLKVALESKNFEAFKEKLFENQALLLENIPSGYMTDKLEIALRLVQKYPEFAGKISGSGFGENIILFAQNNEHIVKLCNDLKKDEIKLSKVEVSVRNK